MIMYLIHNGINVKSTDPVFTEYITVIEITVKDWQESSFIRKIEVKPSTKKCLMKIKSNHYEFKTDVLLKV